MPVELPELVTHENGIRCRADAPKWWGGDTSELVPVPVPDEEPEHRRQRLLRLLAADT